MQENQKDKVKKAKELAVNVFRQNANFGEEVELSESIFELLEVIRALETELKLSGEKMSELKRVTMIASTF